MTTSRQIRQLASLYERRLQAAQERVAAGLARCETATADLGAAEDALERFEADQSEREQRFLAAILGRPVARADWTEREDGALLAGQGRDRLRDQCRRLTQTLRESEANLVRLRGEEAARRRDHDKLADVQAQFERRGARRREALAEAEVEDLTSSRREGSAPC